MKVWGCFTASGLGRLDWWNHEFSSLLNNAEGESLAISLWLGAHLGSTFEKQKKWPSQIPDWNLMEILWHDLTQAVHAWKASSAAELKWLQIRGARILHSNGKHFFATYCKRSDAAAAPGLAQPVIRFRGQFTFSLRWARLSVILYFH